MAALQKGSSEDEGGVSASDPRPSLKVFSSVLTALSEGGSVPSDVRTVRALYAAIATCMQVLVGDDYTSAMQAASAEAAGRDDAAEEFMDKAAVRAEDSVLALWTAPPDAVRLPEETVGARLVASLEDV
jgi:hypothetical protein